MRKALRTGDRPVMFHWILLGSLVTLGVIIASVSAGVLRGAFRGYRLRSGRGIFRALNRPPWSCWARPSWLLSPFSGYLIAKASSATSVLEPALAATVAILLMMALAVLAATRHRGFCPSRCSCCFRLGLRRGLVRPEPLGLAAAPRETEHQTRPVFANKIKGGRWSQTLGDINRKGFPGHHHTVTLLLNASNDRPSGLSRRTRALESRDGFLMEPSELLRFIHPSVSHDIRSDGSGGARNSP